MSVEIYLWRFVLCVGLSIRPDTAPLYYWTGQRDWESYYGLAVRVWPVYVGLGVNVNVTIPRLWG